MFFGYNSVDPQFYRYDNDLVWFAQCLLLDYVVLEIIVLDVFVKFPESCKVLLFILADSFAVMFCATTTPTPVPAPINNKNKNAIITVFIIL